MKLRTFLTHFLFPLLAFLNQIHANYFKPSIVFIIPSEENETHLLNEESQFKINTIKRRGWLIEENVVTPFTLMLKFEFDQEKFDFEKEFTHLPIKIDADYYLFFTTNPNDCSDYIRHTHIPLTIHKSLSRIQQNFIYKTQLDVQLEHSKVPYYMCLQVDRLEEGKFKHQGNVSHLTFITYKSYFSLWEKIAIYSVLILMAATFNGLNLGLMSLSVEELELIIKTSDSLKERKHAENILPLRKNGNFLLCSILLSVTLTSAVSTLLLEDMFNGLLAGIFSTLILCIIGEILPQSIFSRYSLTLSSYCRYYMLFFIIITSPLSYPFSKIIDFILGKEVPTKYSRDTIRELLKKAKNLNEKETQIIQGALDFKNKLVRDVYTRLNDVFMLDESERLNFDTMLYVYNSGYSRIPVYRHERENIVGVFHIKDLSLIDPDDETPLKNLLKMYKHEITYCYESDKLPHMFEIFRYGRTHLAFVYEASNVHTNSEDACCIGIITLHDVIEALVQFDINDEFEYAERAKFGGRAFLKRLVQNYADKKQIYQQSPPEAPRIELIDPQKRLAIHQILSTIIPFKDEYIDRDVLENGLIDDTNVVSIEIPLMQSQEEKIQFIYKYGKQVNFFVLIIEGSMTVEVGEERVEFIANTYEYFGVQALMGDAKTVEQVLDNQPPYKPYTPEFSLLINYKNYGTRMSSTNGEYAKCMYLRIDRNLWLNAVKTTHLKRTNKIL